MYQQYHLFWNYNTFSRKSSVNISTKSTFCRTRCFRCIFVGYHRYHRAPQHVAGGRAERVPWHQHPPPYAKQLRMTDFLGYQPRRYVGLYCTVVVSSGFCRRDKHQKSTISIDWTSFSSKSNQEQRSFWMSGKMCGVKITDKKAFVDQPENLVPKPSRNPPASARVAPLKPGFMGQCFSEVIVFMLFLIWLIPIVLLRLHKFCQGHQLWYF